MGLEWEWRHARKRLAENLVILKKMLVEIRFWAGQVQLGVNCGRCRRQLVCLPQWQTVEVEVWPWSSADLYRQRSCGLRDAQRLCCVRYNSQHCKNCVSLFSCRKTKVKKLVNVSYLNNGESPEFLFLLHLYICIVTIPHFYHIIIIESIKRCANKGLM